MKNNLFLTLVALVALFTACSKDGADQVNLNNEIISATLFHESVSRTALNDLQVVWSADDAISVFTSYGNEYPNNQGALISGAGTTSADFSLVLEGTEKVAALYPYQEDAAFDGSVVSLAMPAEYTYADNDISGAPMAAKILNNASNIAFKNAGAMLVVTLNNIPVGYNKVILTSAEEPIAGACEINFDANDTPVLTTTSSGAEQIVINFAAADEPTSKTFYFPLPVANYPELTISISNGTETQLLKSKALNAARNKRYQSVITLDTVTGDILSEVTGGEAATEKLEGGENTLVVNVVDNSNNSITIPDNTPSNPTSLLFSSISNDEGVVISGGQQASQQVNIQAPADASSNNVFEIILPYSTVSLGANGELATYQSVIAHTAENTLIVEENVTVENLVVKGGNVRVYGKIDAITRDQSNADEFTYVYVEDGATIPANLDDNFVVVRNGVAVVSTVDELTAAAANTNISTIKVIADIALGEKPIEITRDLTIDLNGCTLSGKCNADQDHLIMVQNSATLNVKDSSNGQDGKITFARGASNTGWTIDVCGTLNLYSGIVELTGDSWNIGYVVDVRPNAWGVAYTAPTTFNMYGGKVISSDGGVRVASSSSKEYINISANFNMEDGEIDAGWDGIFIQQSSEKYDILNVTITGGNIKSDLYPVRLYDPVGTSVIGGGKVATTLTISGGSFGKSTSDATSLIPGMLYYGGGIGYTSATLPYTKISVSDCTCGGKNENFTFDSTNLE